MQGVCPARSWLMQYFSRNSCRFIATPLTTGLLGSSTAGTLSPQHRYAQPRLHRGHANTVPTIVVLTAPEL